MNKKIKNYVNDIFDEYPKTPKVYELKDELIVNLTEKYDDLLKKGRSEEEAYNIVIAGIGDISELIANLQESNVLNPVYNLKEQKKSAMYLSVAIMLYILSVIPVILIGYYVGDSVIGVAMMFVMVALATGIIVYRGSIKPKYLKENETLVEEFKEWKSRKGRKDSLQGAITSAMWSFIVVLYFIISFAFGIWYISWVIFIIGGAIAQIIKAIFELRSE